MSIRDEILHRVNERRLFCLEPSLPGDASVRNMFCSEEVWNVLRHADEDFRKILLLRWILTAAKISAGRGRGNGAISS